MKKKLALLLSLAMALGLCACGSETASDSSAPAAEDDGSIVLEKDTPYLVEDSNDITLTITGPLGEDYDDYYIPIEVVNNGDAEVEVDLTNVNVNGYHFDAALLLTIEPGETVEDELMLYGRDFENYGIDGADGLSFVQFCYTYSIDYEDTLGTLAEPMYSPIIRFADTVECGPALDGDLIYEDDYVAAYMLGGVSESAYDGYADYELFIVNKTDDTIDVDFAAASVNGVENTDAMNFYMRVPPRMMEREPNNFALDAYGLTDVSEVTDMTFTLAVASRWVDDFAVEAPSYTVAVQ